MTEGPAVEYRVEVLPAAHELAVTLRLSGELACRPLLATATWVPGAYGFMKYGRDLFDVRAFDLASGEELPIVREGWSGFRVAAAPERLEVRYRACAADPAWAELSGLVGSDQALLLATRLLHPPGHEGPCRVQYVLPPGWGLHHPSGPERLGDGLFGYRDFGELLDTPVVAGHFERLTRELHGTPFHFVFLDRAVGFERRAPEFADAVMEAAAGVQALFGSLPFEDYTFVLSCSPDANWGLEHATSTTCGLGEEVFVDEEAWFDGVRVCLHELVHAWNACRLKPAPLGRPDLLEGAFPDALWVTEGFTRYYEFLLLVRAGQLSPEAFFANLVNYHRQLTALPACARVSLVDSSRATFLNHNRFPGAVNATIDYYDKGLLAAFDLDVALRAGRPAGSLDGLLRELYERYAGQGEGLTHAQAMALVEARSPEAFAVARRDVEGCGEPALVECLERLGFEVGHEERAYAGLILAKEKGPGIADVLDDSPAGASGLAPGDEILAAGGFPFGLKAFGWLVAHEPRFEVEVRRGHRRLLFELAPGRRRRIGALVWRGDAAQAELLRELFGRPPGLTAGRPLALSAHHNFHGIQTVL